MVSYILVVSPVARQDLQKLFQYGCLNWGSMRARQYIARFKTGLLRLHQSPHIGIKRDDLLKDLCVLPVEKHYIFYQLVENKIEIIRILHARLDPQRA